MNYVISDIHGCYEEYVELIQKIKLTEKDHLYILGDTLDKGTEPIKVLLDIMERQNVTYIMGNHDYLFFYFIRRMGLYLSDTTNMSTEDIVDFRKYLENGGYTTIEALLKVKPEEKQKIYDFLAQAVFFKEVVVDHNRYILVHAGISNFREDIAMEKYDSVDFICTRTDYGRRYFKDGNTYIITGHTPTMYINEDNSPKVYIGNGHIAIDCGCIYGGRLAAYCIDSGKATYVGAN